MCDFPSASEAAKLSAENEKKILLNNKALKEYVTEIKKAIANGKCSVKIISTQSEQSDVALKELEKKGYKTRTFYEEEEYGREIYRVEISW